MTSRPLLAAASLVALASVASAGDLASPAIDWTGIYVGFGAGGGFGDAELSASGEGAYSHVLSYVDVVQPQEGSVVSGDTFEGNIRCFLNDNLSCSGDTDSNAAMRSDGGAFGFLARGEIGADYQLERIVMGISGSYTFGDRETSGSGSGGGDALFTRTPENIVYDGEGSGAVSSSLHFGNSWAIGGRLGYLVTDGTLLFGTGGYTQMKTELKSRFSGSGGAGYTELSEDYGIDAEYAIGSSRSEWLGGYYLGAGLEQILWENFSLKFEYRFADYGSIDTSAEAGAGDFINCGNGCWRTSVEAEADVVDHSLMATVSFRM